MYRVHNNGDELAFFRFLLAGSEIPNRKRGTGAGQNAGEESPLEGLGSNLK